MPRPSQCSPAAPPITGYVDLWAILEHDHPYLARPPSGVLSVIYVNAEVNRFMLMGPSAKRFTPPSARPPAGPSSFDLRQCIRRSLAETSFATARNSFPAAPFG